MMLSKSIALNYSNFPGKLHLNFILVNRFMITLRMAHKYANEVNFYVNCSVCVLSQNTLNNIFRQNC